MPSRPSDLDARVTAAAGAFLARRSLPAGAVPAALDTLAEALEMARQGLIAIAADETGLTPDELAPEFSRMTGTLRMFAALARDGSWVRPIIDTRATMSIGPGHDVRRMFIPLGPIAVFGASNFPFAYGACGGDTASALAAGCPVVVKEHPAHPRTGRALAELAAAALAGCGLKDWFQYVRDEDPRDHSIGEALVRDERIAAVGFTGSRAGGQALDKIARERPTPIPVFAEMGSANIVYVLPHAAAARAEAIADEIADTLLTRVGQQCTAPTAVLAVAGESCERLAARLIERLGSWKPRRMLSPNVLNEYNRAFESSAASDPLLPTSVQVFGVKTDSLPREQRQSCGLPGFIRLDARTWAEQDANAIEIFGPGLMLVDFASVEDMARTLGTGAIAPALVAGVYCENAEEAHWLFDGLFPLAGRIVINGPTTGVRVCNAMVHGGPWPATNRPDTTAVGPLAIERWCRPVCFQNCPDDLLPAALQNANPRNLLRTINGELTRGPIA